MINAIKTKYHGIEFRSRIEARWAVYFDLCGCEWEYEPEGFKIELYDGKTINYLPDFLLHNVRGRNIPESGLFVEVKGVMSDFDNLKINAFTSPTCARYCPELNKDWGGFNCKKCTISNKCPYSNLTPENEIENPLIVFSGFPKTADEVFYKIEEKGFPYSYMHIDRDYFECFLFPEKNKSGLVTHDCGGYKYDGDWDLANKFLSIASSVKFEQEQDKIYPLSTYCIEE